MVDRVDIYMGMKNMDTGHLAIGMVWVLVMAVVTALATINMIIMNITDPTTASETNIVSCAPFNALSNSPA